MMVVVYCVTSIPLPVHKYAGACLAQCLTVWYCLCRSRRWELASVQRRGEARAAELRVHLLECGTNRPMSQNDACTSDCL